MFPDGDCTITDFDRRVVSGERELGLPDESGKFAEFGEFGKVVEASEVGKVGELGAVGVGLSASNRSRRSISSERRVI